MRRLARPRLPKMASDVRLGVEAGRVSLEGAATAARRLPKPAVASGYGRHTCIPMWALTPLCRAWSSFGHARGPDGCFRAAPVKPFLGDAAALEFEVC